MDDKLRTTGNPAPSTGESENIDRLFDEAITLLMGSAASQTQQAPNEAANIGNVDADTDTESAGTDSTPLDEAEQADDIVITPRKAGSAHEAGVRHPGSAQAHANGQRSSTAPAHRKHTAKPRQNGTHVVSTRSEAARRSPKLSEKGRRAKSDNPPWVSMVCAACAISLVGIGGLGVWKAMQYSDYLSKQSVVTRNTFHEGAYFEGYPLSGLTLDEASYAANQLIAQVAQQTNITLNIDGQTFSINDDDIGMTTNAHQELACAYSHVRNGSFDERYNKISQLQQSGENLIIERGWNEDRLRTKIQEIADEVYIPPVNAGIESFKVSSGKGSFSFSREKSGARLDKDALYQQLTSAIASGQTNANIAGTMLEVEPKIDIDDMRDNFGFISSASTNTWSDDNRNRNIKLASSAFNGYCLRPGEEFSFNDCTGERTRSKGYREAGAYSYGVSVKELGGGVCQVSTTLYQAVCKADLEITDRSPHSRKSKYSAIGLDAAVSWPGQDMKFVNNTDLPIYITSNYSGGTLTVRVYGKKLEDGMRIKLASKQTGVLRAPSGTRTVKSSSLARGQRKTEGARQGYTAVSYRKYYDADGDLIKTVKLDDSEYPSQQETVCIGTGS